MVVLLAPLHPPCLHTYIMQHINYTSARLWPTGWSNSMQILCMNSSSTFYSELLHLCNLWPIQPPCLHTYTISISIISLHTCGQPAGPTAYLHYLRCHIVYPLFIYCITAKLQPIQLLCQMYTLYSISIISLQTCGPLAGLTACTHYVGSHEVHLSFIYCISTKLQSICLL